MMESQKITKSYLREQLDREAVGVGICTTSINPNPSLKKYYFWVFHYEMPYTSAAEVFWKDEHRLSLKQFLELQAYLRKNGIPYAVVNSAYYRLGTKVWDYEALKRYKPNIEFAVAYDEDTDEACEEFMGHR